MKLSDDSVEMRRGVEVGDERKDGE